MADMFDSDGRVEQFFPLRDYQAQGVADIRSSLARGKRRVLYQLPTGAGKTRVIAEIVRMANQKRSRVILLAPRRELVYQIRDALAAQGVKAGIIMAGERPDLYAQVHVCSFDTLHSRAIQRENIRLPPADLVIVDEARLAVADGRQEILSHYSTQRHVLVDASPARSDGRGLDEIADDLVPGPPMAWLVEQGYLLKLRYFAGSEADLKNVKLNKDGDYQERALGKAVDDPKLIGDIVDNWFRIAPTRRTVVFCVNRKHGRHICGEFVKRGVAAEYIDGDTPSTPSNNERKAILDRVSSGETQVLVNVFVATYGLDVPPLDCCVLARPTKSLALYLQMVGRIMRPFPGQEDGVVIDHAGAVKENGFADDAHPWSLDGKEKIKDRIEKQREQGAEPKQINCALCGYVFKNSRHCPQCGHEMLPPSEAIPTYKVDLQEIERPKGKETAAEKRNRVEGWGSKVQFISELRAFALERKKSDGWVAHKYRERYSVWPNDNRVRNAVAANTAGPEVRSWIKAGQIKFAKRSAPK